MEGQFSFWQKYVFASSIKKRNFALLIAEISAIFREAIYA